MKTNKVIFHENINPIDPANLLPAQVWMPALPIYFLSLERYTYIRGQANLHTYVV